MKYAKSAILSVFAILMFGGALALDASAQTRGNAVVVRRPVVVRRVVTRPYWGWGLYRGYRNPYWGYSGFYDPYYDSPYLRYQEQKFYLERELAGNQRELAKHQEKYRRDGVITAKEQRELEDDVKDVRNARAKLSRAVSGCRSRHQQQKTVARHREGVGQTNAVGGGSVGL